MLRREISLKVICEKVKFKIVCFEIVFVTMNGHTYIDYSKKYMSRDMRFPTISYVRPANA